MVIKNRHLALMYISKTDRESFNKKFPNGFDIHKSSERKKFITFVDKLEAINCLGMKFPFINLITDEKLFAKYNVEDTVEKLFELIRDKKVVFKKYIGYYAFWPQILFEDFKRPEPTNQGK